MRSNWEACRACRHYRIAAFNRAVIIAVLDELDALKIRVEQLRIACGCYIQLVDGHRPVGRRHLEAVHD